MTKDERLYIAGPNCFWPKGGNSLNSYREYALFYGYDTTLPGDPKKMEEKMKERKPFGEMTKKERGASILENCATSMDDTTAILANLDNYRGFSPDGGTIFEIGMAYAKGCKCYAYTRDMRPVGEKFTAGTWTAETIIDEKGRVVPNIDLPFSVDIVGSCKLIQGTYYDCQDLLTTDIREESKAKAMRGTRGEPVPMEATMTSDKPIVYFCDFDRYDANVGEKYAKVKALLEAAGFTAVVPTDKAPGVPVLEDCEDRYAQVYNQFDHFQQHVRNCDIILADLNDFYGYEPNADVSFEAGMAFQLRKKMYGFMDNIGPMIDRVPNKGEDNGCKDINSMGVENFDAPINLMFGSSYTLLDGSLEEVISKMAEDLKK